VTAVQQAIGHLGPDGPQPDQADAERSLLHPAILAGRPGPSPVGVQGRYGPIRCARMSVPPGICEASTTTAKETSRSTVSAAAPRADARAIRRLHCASWRAT